MDVGEFGHLGFLFQMTSVNLVRKLYAYQTCEAGLASFLMMFQLPGARNQFGEYNSIIKDMNHGQKYKIKILAV